MINEPPQQQTDGDRPHIERGGLWGLFLSAAGLILPPFGLILSALGIVQGHRARRAAKAKNGVAPGAILSMVLGWFGVALSALMLVGYLVFWDAYSAYQECSTRALTVSSQQDCDRQLREDIARRAGLPVESVPPVGG
ncbi:DUF4190 domain-containing protein [Streptomonospora nanhaiensis]|uniref:DUF4190 domain-containing protein n=1 Tax=Streptomonospora nanhaiensis TaxID=1323731 RepID=A0A853BS02_9ACTN|nr:DUF4190 domain-containing protein [Streptomonospora nanhaiensis]MBV2367149.1 DUF4190 domain-containing protein [Streptomonospora nanhaiensis]MBX9391423.1 DUF4190 domain-containing protein [Streptomonospora nanhaiensis]NYI97654.1 hypothetical protein [Streptomonospora nanhaiensis]